MNSERTEVKDELVDTNNKPKFEVNRNVFRKTLPSAKAGSLRKSDADDALEIKQEGIKVERAAESTQVLAGKDSEIDNKRSCSVEGEKINMKEHEHFAAYMNSCKQASRSPIRLVGNSPYKKSGSPKVSWRKLNTSSEALWSGNVRPGCRDWSKVKTYERKNKVLEKMCSIKRSQSEEEESLKERQKRSKLDERKADIEEEQNAKAKESQTTVCSSVSNETKKELGNKHLKANKQTPNRPCSPSSSRTSPCAVSIRCLKIQSVNIASEVHTAATTCSSLNGGASTRPTVATTGSGTKMFGSQGISQMAINNDSQGLAKRDMAATTKKLLPHSGEKHWRKLTIWPR